MILFICHGNVARSQFAAALYHSLTGQEAVSAGTHVRPEKDNILLKDDGEAARRALTHFQTVTGIDLSDRQRKPLSRKLTERADRIIVLTEREHLPSWFSECLHKADFWEVADPHDMDFAGYQQTVDLITDRLQRLISDTKPSHQAGKEHT